MCAIFASPVAASATTYTLYPDGSGDFPTIQAAMNAAVDGDEILLGDGVFQGEGNREIQISKSILLRGISGDPLLATIDCEDQVGFELEQNEGEIEIRSLTIQHASPSAILNEDTRFTSTACIFRDNDGCLQGDYNAVIDVGSCQFVGNRGIVVSSSSVVTFQDTEFVDNAGLCIRLLDLDGIPVFDRCSFRNNGSVIHAASEYTPRIRFRNSELISNQGGIELSDVSLTMDDCLIDQNGFGVRIANMGGATVSRTDFLGNGSSTSYGGALSVGYFSTVNLFDCRFADNVAHSGGAIWADEGYVTATRCEFVDNTAAHDGGAFRAEKSGSVTVNDCIFISNQAANRGGALSLDTGNPSIVTNSTIVGCSAPIGSALHSTYSSLVRIVDTVIAGNLGSESTIEVSMPPWYSIPTEIQGCTIVGNEQVSGACLTLDAAFVDRTIVGFNRCAAYASLGDSIATFACSDLYGNAGGDWVAPISSQLGENGNIAGNPLFCDMGQGDFTLASLSPCLDENNDPGCPTIGAFPEAGCLESAPFVFQIQPDGSGYYATIQAALDFAADRDTISLADGVYLGPGNRDLNYHGKEVVIRSESGDPESCVIDCGGTPDEPHRGVLFVSGETAASVLEGVTITGGAAFGSGVARFGGAIYCFESSPTIRNCILEGNAAQRNGGAINLFHSESVIENCVIRGNQAALGAGISSATSSPTIRDTRITGNGASESGGGIRYFSQFTTAPRIESVTISGNESPIGGGIECLEEVSLQIERSIVWDNCADEGDEFRLANAGSAVILTCSDIDTSGVWLEDPAAQFVFEGGDNISLDPEFCDPIECTSTPSITGTFTLDASSPCSPAYAPEGCGLIGAYPVDCDATSDAPPAPSSQETQRTMTLRNDPNPFFGSTTLRFQLPISGRVEVSIYDITGKRIRSLAAGALQAGDHSLEWNSTDDRGRRVPNGVYLCRIRVGSYSATTTLTAVTR